MVSKKLMLILSFLIFGFSFPALSQNKNCDCEEPAKVETKHTCCSKATSHSKLTCLDSCLCNTPFSAASWFNFKNLSQETVKITWAGSALFVKKTDYNNFSNFHFFKFTSRPPITASLSFKQSFLI